MDDWEGENCRIAVGVDFEDFFFDFFVMLLGGFAKEDRFIGLFDMVLPRWPEVLGVHAGDNVDAPHEAFFEKRASNILRLFLRLTRDVDEDHTRNGVPLSYQNFLFRHHDEAF